MIFNINKIRKFYIIPVLLTMQDINDISGDMEHTESILWGGDY